MHLYEITPRVGRQIYVEANSPWAACGIAGLSPNDVLSISLIY